MSKAKAKTRTLINTQTKKGLSETEKSILIDDLLDKGWTNCHLIANWCGNLSLLSENLLKTNTTGASLEEGMFWIRLWSVVVDLHERFSNTVKSGIANGFAVSVAKSIESIRSRLTEEDLIVLDYLRQTNCHITQGGYQKGLNISKTGIESLKDQYTVKTIPKHMKLDAIDKIIRARMETFQADQTAIARDFSRKLSQDLDTLWKFTRDESNRQKLKGRP